MIAVQERRELDYRIEVDPHSEERYQAARRSFEEALAAERSRELDANIRVGSGDRHATGRILWRGLLRAGRHRPHRSSFTVQELRLDWNRDDRARRIAHSRSLRRAHEPGPVYLGSHEVKAHWFGVVLGVVPQEGSQPQGTLTITAEPITTLAALAGPPALSGSASGGIEGSWHERILEAVEATEPCPCSEPGGAWGDLAAEYRACEGLHYAIEEEEQ